MTLISKSNPANHVTPTAVQFGYGGSPRRRWLTESVWIQPHPSLFAAQSTQVEKDKRVHPVSSEACGIADVCWANSASPVSGWKRKSHYPHLPVMLYRQ